MDEKLLQKMIRNCFLQYHHNLDSVPLTAEEYTELMILIKKEKELNPDQDIYDVINDFVYEYLTK
ncbi:YqzH family protein [Litchfieldia alkalitelluris]|uniref:YqzH family protein n=1 Tax=Litchfieldia alkalitelluris TaxID=304268 RepID=UPI00099775E2|nr:YqzH family protein [Litchfieldia alkalitelluris]